MPSYWRWHQLTYVHKNTKIIEDFLRTIFLQIVHNWRKKSDLTSTEFNKSETIAHGNDVAAKSPLTEAKYSTAIDSLLLEQETTNTGKYFKEQK